jgi:hypothetical protein
VWGEQLQQQNPIPDLVLSSSTVGCISAQSICEEVRFSHRLFHIEYKIAIYIRKSLSTFRFCLK